MVSICTLLARKWDIADIVHRLSLQTYTDLEWVVIDFFYEENLESFATVAKHFGVKLVHRPNARNGAVYMRDIARNRNEALVHASGDIIVFLDDYTAVDNNFIENHVNLVKRNNISCGYMYYFRGSRKLVMTDGDGMPTKLEHLRRQIGPDYDHDSREKVFLDNGCIPDTPLTVLGPEWTYTGNLAFSMDVAEKLNGFDPRLSARGEDGDFGLRAHALGIPIMFNPNAASINLSTDGILCKSMFDHDHPVDYFLKNDALVANDPEVVRADGYYVVKKYGTEFVICTKCSAEFMLNPAKFIYRKLRNEEFVIDKKLFNPEKWRTK